MHIHIRQPCSARTGDSLVVRQNGRWLFSTARWTERWKSDEYGTFWVSFPIPTVQRTMGCSTAFILLYSVMATGRIALQISHVVRHNCLEKNNSRDFIQNEEGRHTALEQMCIGFVPWPWGLSIKYFRLTIVRLCYKSIIFSMKQFKTTDIEIIKYYKNIFRFEIPSVRLSWLQTRFLDFNL